MYVLLDTDIGSNIDDALALAYLLARRDCELLGITTVTGEAVDRARLADALCRAAGREISVYPGVEEPLCGEPQQTAAPQARGIDRWPHRRDLPQGAAIDFMSETIRQYPGEIVLIAIGALTNLAILFSGDPQSPALLRGLITMGCCFDEGPAPETNARNDPQAAAIVFSAPLAWHRVLGKDVSRQVELPAADVRARLCSPCLPLLLDLAPDWFAPERVIAFNDPLAAALAFEPGLCAFEQGTVVVGADGRTGFVPGPGEHAIARSVDAARFFAHYFEAFQTA
jgi:purine nucleosidase